MGRQKIINLHSSVKNKFPTINTSDENTLQYGELAVNYAKGSETITVRNTNDEIDRFYPSSKTCSMCGYKKTDLTVKDRYWICPNCGTYLDRDINAARNILTEGQRILSQ